MFSIPINPKLNEKQFAEFYEFCKEYKPYIYDLYFTCRMPPFVQDAMGDVFISDSNITIEQALMMQQSLGIKISAVFNNTLVRPSQENLDLFIHNFRQLYRAGISSATIPHTHWLSTGQIQKVFPKLEIKNTILRNVTKANEIAKLAEAGFHYINLDRDLMRDRDTLVECKRAADKYSVKLSLLANEGCLGNCPMMDEHFQFNNTRFDNSPQYFNDAISRVSCPKWDYEDPATPLKTADFPPWREDWVELLQYVDVIKMHGRESINRLNDTMDIVKRFANNEEILFDTFNDYIKQTNLENKPIDGWRKIIKNCKFNCWDCNYCDNVYKAKSNQQSHPLILAATKELVDSVNYDINHKVLGLTSTRVQRLLYGLSKHCNNYLEIGSALGSTAVAIADNCKLHCVDNWSHDIQPAEAGFELPSNTKQAFLKNINRDVTIFDQDMFTVDVSKLSNIDLFFYDGPHTLEDTKNAIKHYSKCFAEYSILVFDDANWDQVVIGVDEGIKESNLIPLYSKKILNKVEDTNMWWNGIYIMVVGREDTQTN
jgi:predicted O-methyltransferase YrrM